MTREVRKKCTASEAASTKNLRRPAFVFSPSSFPPFYVLCSSFYVSQPPRMTQLPNPTRKME